MDVRLPDGTVIQNVPDGISKADLVTKLKANGYDTSTLEAPPQTNLQRIIGQPSDFVEGLKNFAGKNAVLGAVRGAADIGSTIMRPFQAAFDPPGANEATKAGIEGGLDALGADKNSYAYRSGRIAAQGAGTAGVGGALAAPVRALAPVVPELTPVANALASGGFSLGVPKAATVGGQVVQQGARALGGAGSAGATVGLVDPDHAGTAAIVGGVLPGGAQVSGKLGNVAADVGQAAAARLMESALKPTLKQKMTGDAATAVQVLLDYGINPTKAGVNKLRDLIGSLNDRVSNAISGSSATIDPQNVVNALASTRQKFGNQVAPTADLNAINNVEADFLANGGAGPIPVQLAQKMKQGTYSTLSGKYGQLGSAETEAQKSLARGLKNEIATAVPEVAPLNAEESKLLSALSVTERRALMDVNKNPMGLAALAIHEPTAFIAFMADKSAAFKSLAARAINQATNANGQAVAQNMLGYARNPLVRSSTLALSNQASPQ